MTAPKQATARFSIGGSLVSTAAIAGTCAAAMYHGLAGVSIFLAGTACVWFGISRCRSPSLLPINAHKLTISELFTLLCLCALALGFSLPDVSSVPRGRAPIGPPAPAQAPMQPGG